MMTPAVEPSNEARAAVASQKVEAGGRQIQEDGIGQQFSPHHDAVRTVSRLVYCTIFSRISGRCGVYWYDRRG